MRSRVAAVVLGVFTMIVGVLAVTTASPTPVAAATPTPGPIRFDEFPIGTPLSTQYQSYGVHFSTLFPAFITTDGAQPGSPVASGTPLYQGPIVVLIVDPVTGQPATADGFKMDLGYINNPNSVEVAYFDAFSNKIGAIRANAFGINPINVPARGVSRIDITVVANEDAGYSIDNLEINTVVTGIAPTRMISFGDSYTAGEGLLGENGRRYDCGTDMSKAVYYENTTYAVYTGTPQADMCETTTGQHPQPGAALDWWQRPYKTYENLCHRHGGAWPVLVRQALGIPGSHQQFVACSGAVTANIGYTVTQKPSYKDSPNGVAGGELQKKNALDFRGPAATHDDFVTIGVGGNDAGFADLIKECIWGDGAFWGLFNSNRCLDDPDFGPSVLAKINEVVYPRLVTTFAGVAHDFDGATFLAYGYPSVVDPDTPACKGFDLGTKTLDVDERRWVKDELLPTLNQAIADAAAATGMTYMDITSVTAGKTICTDGEFINGIRGGNDKVVIGNESFHLNERGHAAVGQYFMDHYTDGQGHLTFTNPTANPNLRPASQPIRLNVGTVNVSPEGGCGGSCVQPACSPASCNLGVQLSGFDPDTVLTVKMYSDPVTLGTVTTDSNGEATLDAPVPPGLTGEHTLVVSGTSPGGVRQRASFPIDVTAVVLPDDAALTPLVPARLLDSRGGATTIDGAQAADGRRDAGSVTEVTVAGRGGVPATASAVVLNVTAVSPDAAGYLTVYPCGAERPLASNVNYTPGQIIPNAVVAKVGDNGKVCVFTLVGSDLVVDVNGFVPAVGSPGPLVPARLLDSRAGATTIDGAQAADGRRAAGSVTEVTVAGRGGVPATASAVVLNVTAVSPDAAGYLTVYPCGAERPLASNVNYTPGQIIPNAVVAKVGDNGKVCVFTLVGSDLVVDVNGFVPAVGSPGPLVPARLLDSRAGATTIDGAQAADGRRAAGSVTEVTVAGRGGVPATASAVVLNVTAVSPDAAGYLTVYPCGAERPLASNVNYTPGQIIPNAVVAKVGDNGKVCVFTLVGSDLVVDVNGYVR